MIAENMMREEIKETCFLDRSAQRRATIIKGTVATAIIALYRSGLGHKAISHQTGISATTIRYALIRLGEWTPGSIPRKARGILISEARQRAKDRVWQSAAWRDEWRGVIEDYTGRYLRILKSREKANEVSSRKYRAMSPGERKNHNRNMVARQGEKRRSRAKAWRTSDHGRLKRREWRRKESASNPAFRIRLSVAGRIRDALKYNYSAKTERSEFYVGCSWAELRAHLERQFKRGMSWSNYGPAWHIDHIVPCALFDLTNSEELRRCFHFTNLRPLWALENIKRGCRAGTIQAGLGI